jgi:Zn-dependent peptidase ImmA (M78 family)
LAKTISVPYLQLQDIWNEAEKVRDKCWGKSIPVNVDVISEKCFDLIVIPIPGMAKWVNSEAYITGNLKEMHVDQLANDVRLRFSIAHELGHAVLHAAQIRQLRAGTFDEWKEMIEVLPDGVWGRAEFQAREFAGRLLVPYEILMQEILKLKPKIDKAKTIPNIEQDAIAQYVASAVCRQFDVSSQVIVARIKSEGIDLLNV